MDRGICWERWMGYTVLYHYLPTCYSSMISRWMGVYCCTTDFFLWLQTMAAEDASWSSWLLVRKHGGKSIDSSGWSTVQFSEIRTSGCRCHYSDPWISRLLVRGITRNSEENADSRSNPSLTRSPETVFGGGTHLTGSFGHAPGKWIAMNNHDPILAHWQCSRNRWGSKNRLPPILILGDDFLLISQRNRPISKNQTRPGSTNQLPGGMREP
jgi:hypothetical protein